MLRVVASALTACSRLAGPATAPRSALKRLVLRVEAVREGLQPGCELCVAVVDALQPGPPTQRLAERINVAAAASTPWRTCSLVS